MLMKHTIKLGDKTIKYTTTTGLMPISNAEGEVEANIFFVAYTRDDIDKSAKRPLMFAFNGGPGSASVWLHLGALGPKRVDMPKVEIPAPPYELVDNASTWLDKTDLVFIDPVGTGYSRALKTDLTKKFHSLQGDISSISEFIRMYLTRYERWTSPLFMVGESYGTTRAAGLSGRLIERYGIAFNGIILISTVLDFQTLQFDKGNDIAYVLYLPAYTATAWYHKKLSPDLQKDLKTTIDAAEKWALNEYTVALAKGSRLPENERKAVAAKLASLTGLSPEYFELANLRVDPSRFRKELFRKEGKAAGRLDSRFVGDEASGIAERPDLDVSNAAIRPPFTATINHSIRTSLRYTTDVPYYILGEGVNSWDYGIGGRGGYAGTSTALRDAFAQNPSMKVMVASGYYDLATPFLAAEYTFEHMDLDPKVRKNVTFKEYESGHMMYIHPESLPKLKVDVDAFIEQSLKK
jgi:carboxypeptidase C (cathepsin A)